jgi:hypothetical protein
VTYVKNTKKSFLVQICQQCGYIANPENFNDYTKYKALTQFPLTRGSALTSSPAASSAWRRWVCGSSVGGRWT